MTLSSASKDEVKYCVPFIWLLNNLTVVVATSKALTPFATKHCPSVILYVFFLDLFKYLTEFAGTCPHWLNDSLTSQNSSDHPPPRLGAWPLMHASGMGHVNTEPSNKVQKLSEIHVPRNAVNKGYLTLKTQSLASWGCQYNTPPPSSPACFWQLAISKPPANRPVPRQYVRPGLDGA